MRLIVATTSTEVTCQPDTMKITVMLSAVFCNRFDEGNIYNYRERLVNKIGLSRVLLLEAKKNQTCKLSDFELKALISHYKAEVKRLKEEKKCKMA